jgi:ATP-dependent RNA helicase RhlE
MHAEDYVHRIGRTGRAHAVGDAISFISQEDYAPLKTLERFIGRGIVRKKAEGFDYTAAAPPQTEERRNFGGREAQGGRRRPASPPSRGNARGHESYRGRR